MHATNAANHYATPPTVCVSAMTCSRIVSYRIVRSAWSNVCNARAHIVSPTPGRYYLSLRRSVPRSVTRRFSFRISVYRQQRNRKRRGCLLSSSRPEMAGTEHAQSGVSRGQRLTSSGQACERVPTANPSSFAFSHSRLFSVRIFFN